MFERAQIKAAAKDQIRGKIGILFVCTLVIGLLTGVASIVSWLVFPAFGISSILIYLGLIGGKKPEVSDVFAGFKVFGKAFWLMFLTGFFTMLWSCLFFVPGIIKAISYSMAPYILAENPDMTARQALDESKRITKGAKMDLFVLQLSFIGWAMLCGITFGIAYIYVGPYMQATSANAYLAIKAKQQQEPPAFS